MTSKMAAKMKIYLCQLVLLLISATNWTASHETELTMSGCLRGSQCSQCPQNKYTLDGYGDMVCCAGCLSAVLYHGQEPNDWCVCYIEVEKNDAEAKTLKFPGHGSRLPATYNEASSDIVFGNQYSGDKPGQFNLKDLYIMNQESSGDVAPSVQQAITLLANTIEDLNVRLTRVEDIILREVTGNNIDRVGAAAEPDNHIGNDNLASASASSSSEPPCPAEGFIRVKGVCYYFSSLNQNDYRADWPGARQKCIDMGAKLAEPIESGVFYDLTQYLSLASETTGYSYWTGGFYPGVSWLWSYESMKVTTSAAYWSSVDSNGNSVEPGDTRPGRCLSLSYMQGDSNYYYAADECGYGKYYICELLHRTHRRF